MLKLASWIHGNTLVVEEPNKVILKHIGWGTELLFVSGLGQTPTKTWCHIAIPTPVIVNGVRLKVQNIFMLFKTGQHAAIDNIHIYDGPNRIFTWDVVTGSNYSARRSGDHSKVIDSQSTFTLPTPHELNFGLSISFTFTPVALNTLIPDPEGKLTVTCAGADFI